ncbi:hypothetical protein BC835DRAFT_1022011 [Cytidiella melzeri]|nr:hypothetical protein BC835DRAFT_1022011 [Cytidiella melzeri]
MRRQLLVQVIIGVPWAVAHPAVSYYPSARSIERRQVAPPGPTSSYDYWWPYPPWSASSAAVSPTSPGYPVAPLPDAPITSIVTPLTAVATSSAINLPSTNLAAVDNTLTTSSSPSSITPQSTPTSPANVLLTTITALPPGVNPARHYKQSKASPFQAGYLACIFAVVGAIVGVVFSWITLTIIRKCSERREKPFVAGAPYFAPPETNGDTETAEFHESVSRFLGVPPPESRPTLAGGAEVGRQRSWLQRAFTSHRREGARSRADSAAHGIAGVEESSARDEDAPFLALPSRGHSTARCPSSSDERDLERARLMLERNTQSPQELEEDDALDSAPFDTLRHKSIRRGIVDRIRQGSRYRKGHKRVDSDVIVEDVRGSEGGESVLTLAFRDELPATDNSSPPEDPASLSLPVSSQTSSGPGFRIIEEDTEADSRYSQGSNGPGWSFPRAPASPTKTHTTDTYTSLPTRVLSSERRNSFRGTRQTPKRTRSPTLQFTRADSSVLPSSPPRVTSPPLEAQLFFGASPSFGSAPKLDFTVSSDGTKRSGRLEESFPQSPEKNKAKHANKLRTRRGAPPLPFPSSPEFTQPNHLTKNTPHAPLVTSSLENRYMSNASSSSAATPAERFARRHGALNKVEQIVAQSWNARESRGQECPASPTMFGAVSQEHEKPSAGGIEQRLLQM